MNAVSALADRQPRQSVDSRRAVDLECLFAQLFLAKHQTLLVGGADEPLYQPAVSAGDVHRIYYRQDYFSSALHEVAHWCIAGAERRRKVDYGYWYSPDGRDTKQQRAFERVEARPQALESLFSRAAGVSFRPSIDNLSAGSCSADDFLEAVRAQESDYEEAGLPARAAHFRRELLRFYSRPS